MNLKLVEMLVLSLRYVRAPGIKTAWIGTGLRVAMICGGTEQESHLKSNEIYINN